MELIVLILAALPIGFFVRNRTAAFIGYIALQAFVFTFQSISLVIEWVGGSTKAFGDYPDASTGDVYSYAVVNLFIYAAGLGLVILGQRLARRRAVRSSASLDPVA